MLSAQLQADVQALASAVTANAPLKNLPALQLEVLRTQASAVVAEVDAALAGAAGALDAGDPSGFLGDFVGDLRGLAEASRDQEKLARMRGFVGRAAFNIAQVFS